jgi:Xaa-Pro aminopeptidase
MKTDLDRLMEISNLDAILVTGPAQHNPPMVYLTGGGNLIQADLIKKRGSPALLFHGAMERDEAAKSGLATKDLGDYNYEDLLRQADGDNLQATILRYRQMFVDAGVASGRVAIYGRADAGSSYAIFSGLQRLLPDVTLVGEVGDAMLLQVMATKDESEVERIRHMGMVTTQVVSLVADFLTSHVARDGMLVKSDGQPLTIGEVKSRINLWLAERGAQNPEGTIFAIGRDATVPHSCGNPDDTLSLGKTIVFDIFPCEAGGGYHYDFTRTWCLGYAPDEVQSLYEDVLAVYRQVMSELKSGALCREFQKRACDLFEARGHATIQSSPQTKEGFVHGLGHGLGLNVHERPWFGKNATDDDRLSPGVVVTIEPGLYYPERGMGVRLEDTVWARPDGSFEILVDYPKDLVLPVKKR